MLGKVRVEPRSSGSDVDTAVGGIGLWPALQPIVSLPDQQIVGFEALARWPGTGLSPAVVFDHALRTARLDALDQHCIDHALRAAEAAKLPSMAMLTINCEPASPYRSRAHHPVLDQAANRYTVVFEITERRLLEHPKALLAKIDAIRADGFAIALDDLGSHADSLALLDIVSPDIVKLDLDLIQHRPHREQARTLSAVISYHERSGAVIVAEGIETDAHREQALALGATFGQGYKFGYPQPPKDIASDLVMPWPEPGPVPPVSGSTNSDCPFEVMTRDWAKPVRTARKEILVSLCRYIERQASDTVDPPMVLTALQDHRNVTVTTHHRYEKLTRTAPLVAIFGHGLPAEPVPGVRGIALDRADPLCEEWTVVALGARTAAALIAREHDSEPPSNDADRLFDFVVTYDRALVTSAARALLRRID